MISIKNITVSYPRSETAPAISSLDLSLEQGEYLSILGPNGSGKSTLIKVICGMVEHKAGEIIIDGNRVRPGRFGDDLFGKVAAVFQEPSGQFLMPDVRTEILAVLQNLGLQPDKASIIFDKIVSQFSLERILDLKPYNLSGGQMQVVNLACAVAVSPDVLLLDEPTTFLDSMYRQAIMDLIDQLNTDGLTVIHVTQYSTEAARAGKVAIMKSGKIIALGKPRDILGNDNLLAKNRLTTPREILCERFFGFDLNDENAVDCYCSSFPDYDKSPKIIPGESSDDKSMLLSVDDLSFSYPDNGFSIDIDKLRLYRGSVTGIVGPTGSGKSTLAFLLAGLLKPQNGDISLCGSSISDYGLKDLRKKIGISWQMPDAVLIGPTVADDLRSIIDNLALSDIDIEEILAKVKLAGFENRIVDTLSGGEKRKIALAGTLVSDPDVVILDEPAAFLDPFSQAQLAEIINELAESGKAVMVIAHDLPFLSEIADEIAAMRDGKILFTIPSVDFFNDPKWPEYIGFPRDPMIYLRHRLAERGLKLEKSSLNPAYIASEIRGIEAKKGKSLDN